MKMSFMKLIEKIMLKIVMFKLKPLLKNIKSLLRKKMEKELLLFLKMEKKLLKMNYLKNTKLNWKI